MQVLQSDKLSMKECQESKTKHDKFYRKTEMLTSHSAKDSICQCGHQFKASEKFFTIISIST